MPASLDLNFLPLVRQNGQDLPELPGLYAVTPPRRAARGRDSDILALYFTLTGSESFSAQQYNELLVRLAQTYYKTSGPVTAALRVVADTLNSFLLDRNQKLPGAGQQSIGLLSQIVLKGDMLYLAQSGPVQAYLITPEGTQWMYDPEGSGRGIGLGRTVPVRFYNLSLHPNEYLLVAHQPAPGWDTSSLHFTAGQNLESLRRRLLSLAGLDLGAILIQALGGTGKLRYLRLKPAFQDMARPTQAVPPTPAQQPEAVGAQTAEAEAAQADESEAAATADLEPPVSAAAELQPEMAEAAGQVEKQVSEPVQAEKGSEKVVVAPAAPISKLAEAEAKPATAKLTANKPTATTSSAATPPASKPLADRSPMTASSRAARRALRKGSATSKTVGRAAGAFTAALAVFGQALIHFFSSIGRALQGILRRILPDETLMRKKILETGLDLLQKPIKARDLLVKIRAVLDG